MDLDVKSPEDDLVGEDDVVTACKGGLMWCVTACHVTCHDPILVWAVLSVCYIDANRRPNG